MRRRVAHPSVVAAALAILAVAGTSCGHAPAHEPAQEAPGSAIAIDVVVPDSSAPAALILPARVKAREEVTVTARLSGRLSVLLAREGERVRAGQTLARFDAPESRLALEAARREVSAARVRLATESRQLARMDSLVARGVASARDREVIEAAHHDAEARLSTAEAAVENLDAALAPRTPFAGVVARRHVDPGSDVAFGAPLFDLRSSDGLEIVAAVPEGALPAVEGGRWDVEAGAGTWVPAALQRIDGMTDATTRTRGVRLTSAGIAALEPGAYTRVRLRSPRLPSEAGNGISWRLPSSAIVRRGALRGAFVVTGDRAELRWLQLGREETGGVEVLAGLEAEDRVARNAGGLEDGAPVRVSR